MNRQKKDGLENVFGFIQFFVDLCFVFASYFISIYIRYIAGSPYSSKNFLSLQAFMPYALVVFALLFIVYRLYNFNRMSFYEVFVDILIASFMLLVFGFALSFFLRAFAVPRSLILITFFIQIILLTLAHFITRNIYLHALLFSNVIVIAKSKEDGEAIIPYIKQYFFKINNGAVFVTDNDRIENISEWFDTFDLFVINSGYSAEEKAQMIEMLDQANKRTYIIPEVADLLLLNQNSYIAGDLSMLSFSVNSMSIADEIVKKIIDVVISIVALVVFSPVFLFTSIAIIKEDGRPVFYLQNRVGKDGKIFKIIKFRTMVKDAEKYTGAVLSNGNDPRITKVGKFLRKTGLDEVPQFINVLKGEMSVVGPRPERPELISEIKKTVPNYDIRLKVQPGITGFAQIYGRYDTPFEQKLKMDILYMRSKSFLFTDIYIILNTLKLFFSPQKRA